MASFSTMNESSPLKIQTPGAVLQLQNGTALYAHDSGSGEPLLLLHGVGLCADDWIGPASHLGDRFRVIRVDARGHGRSSAPKGQWQLADFTADLAALLDRLEIGKVNLAGFSMGGLIAQAFTLHYPERVKKLAILAATTGRNENEQGSIEERLNYLRAHHPGSYFRERACPRWFTDEFQIAAPDVVTYCERVVAANDHEAYIKAYEVLVNNDLADELPRIKQETLVLTGEHDIGAGPRAAELIASRIPKSRLIIVPRLRHHILLEAPDIVGGILREFFTI
jgi:pimeloyl-ACP methyl ester carboxylesterase